MVLVDSLHGFSLWDWGIVFLLTVSTLVRIWRCFSREAISLIGWIISFVIANLYAGTAAISLEGVIDNAMARLLASWLLIFIVVLLTTAFFSKVFSKVVFAVGLGFLDRLLGIVFGFARGVILPWSLFSLVEKYHQLCLKTCSHSLNWFGRLRCWWIGLWGCSVRILMISCLPKNDFLKR